MVLAHGGTLVGYSLYVKEGKVVFTVRHGTNEIKRVVSRIAVSGLTRIQAGLTNEGTLRLSVNQNEAVTVSSRGLLPSHPAEDFCVGHDNGNPLDEQAPRGRFNGKISSLSVAVD